MKTSLPVIALKRPVAVLMISLSLLVIGTIAWFKTPLKFLPKIEEPFVICQIPYSGASPAQVEQQVAIPAEGEFRTISGLKRINSTSTSDGCQIAMNFEVDMDMTLATAEVRDRMERIKLVLPDEIDQMLIYRFSSGSFPVMVMGLFREGDQESFAHDVRTMLEPRLSRLDGVAKVEVHSPVREKEVLIEFDPNRLRNLNLDLLQVINALRDASINITVGEIFDSNKKCYVRVQDEYEKLRDLQELIIGENTLRLKEVAEVRFHGREEEMHVSLDNKGGVLLLVTKESEANTVATCRLINAELDRIMAEPYFRNISMKIFLDQAELIGGALKNLFKSGIYGACMAFLVLLVFIHRVRPTIIVALAIPSSLLVAFVMMFFLDMSLNLITMVSMIIAVGMLVDNAIVVVENIIRHRQKGEDRFESARKGAKEVGLAIFASTVTTWVVFVPMFYLEAGPMEIFMAQLGLPLIFALGGSLLIALTVIPLTMSRIHEHKHASPEAWLAYRSEEAVTPVTRHLWGGLRRILGVQLIQRTIRMYVRMLSFSLRWRLVVLLLLGGLIILTFVLPMKKVGMTQMPELDTREIALEVELDQNYDMAMARDLFMQISERIELIRDDLGIKNLLCFHGSQTGAIQIYLYTQDDDPKWATPEVSTLEALERLKSVIPEQLPGALLTLSVAQAEEDGGKRQLSVRMRGDDREELTKMADRFELILKGMESFDDVKTSLERDKTEMRIKIDEALAWKRGISPMVLAQTVDASLRGARLPYMKQGGREIPVWAQFNEETRKTKANLENVFILGQGEQLSLLDELVHFEQAKSSSSIRRVNGKNVVDFSITANKDNMAEINRELQQVMADFSMPVGYSFEMGQRMKDLAENTTQFMTTLLMAVILIYLVMSALFESFMLPLSILTTVPLALGGSVWMLYFTGNQMDMITLIGNILMVGIIVNNGIVIVDHINMLRNEEIRRFEAILLAGRDRFRPVMMTAITTILGLVPLAIATSGGAANFAGLGRSLIGGLTAGTLLTLFIVPVFYTLLDDLRQWCVDFFGGLGGGHPAG